MNRFKRKASALPHSKLKFLRSTDDKPREFKEIGEFVWRRSAYVWIFSSRSKARCCLVSVVVTTSMVGASTSCNPTTRTTDRMRPSLAARAKDLVDLKLRTKRAKLPWRRQGGPFANFLTPHPSVRACAARIYEGAKKTV